ncbi:MAG TPA: polysaccharide biosynthesis tyrosine autokinase [Solimonas sp.]|nr:polysaccharide biosynthesis tyrosine autokinase [Solimonas sp.]
MQERSLEELAIPAGPPGVPDVQPEWMDPLRQLRILARYKWQIIGMLLLSLLAALLALMAIKPTYRGTATLLIEPQSANVVKIQEVYQPETSMWKPTEHQKTQVELLRSRMLAEQVFTELKLAENPEFKRDEPSKSTAPGMLSDVEALLRQSLGGTGGNERRGVEQLMERLHVEPVMDTNLVKVSADAHSPELSAQISNALLAAYIRYDQQSRGGLADQASGWLNQRLEEIRADLERAETALQAFYDSEQLVNVGGARGMVESEITDNAQRLRDAQRVKTELENVYRRIIAARNAVERLEEIPVIAQEPLVQSTKRSYIEAQREAGGLESRYGKNHPKMVTAQARLDDALDAYRKQVTLAADGIRSQYEIAQTTETSLASVVQSSKAQIRGLDRKQNQVEMLQREVDSNRKLYETFLERSKETDIAGNLDIGKTRVIEQAVVPNEPHRPRKSLWLVAAGMAGLFLGTAIALLRGYLDDTIKTPLDLERLLAIPALAVLPRVRKTGKRGERLVHMERNEPGAIFSEGVRTLRTSLLLADAGHKRTRILVTSAVPGEGKTSIALNLAMALGQMERVILIDADLRKPSIAGSLKLPDKSKGVTDVIAGTVELAPCILRHAEGNIDVLPCGSLPPNPLELIGSARFTALLKVLSESYDRVVIDSPPTMPVSDSLVLGRYADAVLFLVKADSTPGRLVAASVRQLRKAGAPLIGAVLNQADTRRQSGFSYGYYYYQGGYGSYTGK